MRYLSLIHISHIDGGVWHLDVGSSHPGAGEGPKGWAVRPLKWHASWVQNVVRQFGIAAFAPPLDGSGNSVKAQLAIQYIMNKLELNVFSNNHITVVD